MSFFLERLSLNRIWIIVFSLFLITSAFFCGFTRVNNIFHASGVLFLVMLWRNSDLRHQIFKNKRLVIGLVICTMYLLYYSLTNLWSSQPKNIESTLTHSVYLILFLAMLATIINSRYRIQIYLAISIGFASLAVFLISVDYKNILINRLVYIATPCPENVIDVGGYFAMGIILSLIAYRSLKNYWILLLTGILLVAMFLTQSRGPIIACFLSLLITSHIRIFNRRNVSISALLLISAGIILGLSGIGSIIIERFFELTTQVYLRLSIWHHSLNIIMDAPFFGHGFNAKLQFTNYSGEFITTTHSLYLGALLKGGLVGFFLMLLIIGYGLHGAITCIKNGRRLEAALFIFMLIFYISQGIFNIGNPAEFWYLFWFPLGVMMTAPHTMKLTGYQHR
jgi:O-antigen ligase